MFTPLIRGVHPGVFTPRVLTMYISVFGVHPKRGVHPKMGVHPSEEGCYEKNDQREQGRRGLNSSYVWIGGLQIYSTKAESQWIVAHRPLSQKRLTIPGPLLKSYTMDLFPQTLPNFVQYQSMGFIPPLGPKCMIFGFPLL